MSNYRHRLDLTTQQMLRLRLAVMNARTFHISNRTLQQSFLRDDDLSAEEVSKVNANIAASNQMIEELQELANLINASELVFLDVSATVT